jgi:N-acetylmuramoyl-L-alanine amidase
VIKVSTAINFIGKIAQTAVAGMRESRVPASLIIAQAILESSWGTSELATKANNLFGIKGSGPAGSYRRVSAEYVNGQKIQKASDFKKYNSWAESIRDHTEFLLKPRYVKVIGADWKTACREVYAAGYATDPQYPQKLMRLIEQYKLYEYDKQGGENVTKPIVLIDPGHGAETAGKRSPDGTLREYEFNRNVARRLVKKLQSSGFDARLTVNDDKDMPLIQRTNQARDLKRQGQNVLLVSIHANAAGNGWSTANGIETYTNDQAEKLAQFIQRRLVADTSLRDRGVKRADLHITRETAKYGIPGVLCELGFMTNRDECMLLKTDAYREKCATAIAKAICEHYGVPFKTSTENPQPAQKPKVAIEINGSRLPVQGYLRDGVSWLPIRAVAEAAGGKVEWCACTKQVRVNGKDVTETIENGTSYAPARELAAILGLAVEWCGQTKTVKLKKGCA